MSSVARHLTSAAGVSTVSTMSRVVPDQSQPYVPSAEMAPCAVAPQQHTRHARVRRKSGGCAGGRRAEGGGPEGGRAVLCRMQNASVPANAPVSLFHPPSLPQARSRPAAGPRGNGPAPAPGADETRGGRTGQGRAHPTLRHRPGCPRCLPGAPHPARPAAGHANADVHGHGSASRRGHAGRAGGDTAAGRRASHALVAVASPAVAGERGAGRGGALAADLVDGAAVQGLGSSPLVVRVVLRQQVRVHCARSRTGQQRQTVRPTRRRSARASGGRRRRQGGGHGAGGARGRAALDRAVLATGPGLGLADPGRPGKALSVSTADSAARRHTWLLLRHGWRSTLGRGRSTRARASLGENGP